MDKLTATMSAFRSLQSDKRRAGQLAPGSELSLCFRETEADLVAILARRTRGRAPDGGLPLSAGLRAALLARRVASGSGFAVVVLADEEMLAHSPIHEWIDERFLPRARRSGPSVRVGDPPAVHGLGGAAAGGGLLVLITDDAQLDFWRAAGGDDDTDLFVVHVETPP